jgi:hypothetical protein
VYSFYYASFGYSICIFKPTQSLDFNIIYYVPIIIIIIIITIIIIIIQARYCKYTSVSIKKTEIDTLKINAAHWT